MDPYLEEPSGWPGVHHRLISVLSDALTEQVAPRYTVNIEDAQQADETFTMLMGDLVPPRRRFIQTHAAEVTNIDV